MMQHTCWIDERMYKKQYPRKSSRFKPKSRQNIDLMAINNGKITNSTLSMGN
jgi:hypothetical protein